MTVLGVVFPNQNGTGQPSHRPWLETKGLGPRKQHAQRRIQRHRQERRNGHGQILRIGQRLKKPTFLVHKGEHRHKCHRDDQQREEHRRPDFHQRFQAHLVEILLFAAGLPEVDLVVCVFDLDDGAIDQHTNGNRDPCQRHQVRV